MVEPFSFARLPLILFGKGRFGLLAGLVNQYGRQVLLVTGRSSFAESAYLKQLSADLEEKKIDVHQVTVGDEPRPDIIDSIVKEFGEAKIDLVVAVGGGSAVDAGKAISAMLPVRDSVRNYLEGVGTKNHPGIKVPFIAVPTTAGTGSEATKNAVLSETGPEGFKRSLRHENFVPDIAVVDPVLTISCPPAITAASGMDCFTQLIEAYLSVKAGNYTDVLALEGLKAVKSSLIAAYQNGKNIEARTGMAFAALTSGICLANAGLGAVHGFASSLGARYGLPHGIICGTLMAKANEINVRVLRRERSNDYALMKYEVLGRLFLGDSAKSRDYYIDGFISHLHALTETLNLPRLGILGVLGEEAGIVSAVTDIKNNPVRLSHEDLAEILADRI